MFSFFKRTIALKITAWDPGEFTTTINIWGEALAREPTDA